MASVTAEMTEDATPSWDMLDLVHAFLTAPSYHVIVEVLLILWILHLIFKKSYKPSRTNLTEKEKADLIESYQPEPLVPVIPDDHPVLQNMYNRIVDGKIGKKMVINGKECLNAASLNFLCMVGRPEIEEYALTCMRKYGVGPCGPRGFFGTIDVHLLLEERLSEFLQVEEVAVYPYGFATMASVIPAYSKRGDIIICDEGVNFSTQQGLVASRSEVVYYKHNDMDDLERVLKLQARHFSIVLVRRGEIACLGWSLRDPQKAKVARRFLVAEGLSIKYADICPLPRLVELKKKYKLRLFLDESLSFGVLGKTGKGLTEYFNVPIDEIDFLSMSLENALGCGGGFVCGKSYIVDFQRLNSLGYAFSCSIPAMISQASNGALTIMQKNPGLLVQLKENSHYMHKLLQKLPECLQAVGVDESPIHLIQLSQHASNKQHNISLPYIVKNAEEEGVALTMAAYLQEERFEPPSSIRLAVNCEMTEEEMDHIVEVITRCVQQQLSNTIQHTQCDEE